MTIKDLEDWGVARSILNPDNSILQLPHLFPDYPALEKSARAPETVLPRAIIPVATQEVYSIAGASVPRTGETPMVRGNIPDTRKIIRGATRSRSDGLILNHIQKSVLDVDLSGFLKL